jgi:hypothetical protein
MLPLLHAASIARPAEGALAKPLVYVASSSNNTIYVFDRNGQATGTITDGVNQPVGLYVDAQHDLWVANPGANDVLVFKRGASSPSVTISDPNAPNDVAQCPNGTTYVTDAGGLGGIGVYPPGHTTPVRRLEPQISGVGGFEFYDTCDAKGNVFAVGFIGLSPVLATQGWRHGKEAGYYMLADYNFFGAGIVATPRGTLLISDSLGSDSSQPAVVEFTEAGQTTGRAVTTASVVWSGLAFDQTRDVIYGAATSANEGAALKFPGGAVGVSFAANGLGSPQGIAFDPGG